MSIITLTTDYGLKDHFVGALKGKIWSENIDAKIVDISHDIDAFNHAEASYIIGCAYKSFPKGTVHIIGVDCELNIENQHVAILWNDQYFICADNGILGMLTQNIVPQKIVAINIHDRLPSEATDMDVFIVVANHLSKGGLLNVIGKEITEIKTFTELKPVIEPDLIKGYIMYIDHFGNAVTNISKRLFTETRRGRSYKIDLSKSYKNNANIIKTIYNKYSDIGMNQKYPLKNYEGEKLAIFNEANYLEIAIFRSNPNKHGSANSLLGLNYRDEIIIYFND